MRFEREWVENEIGTSILSGLDDDIFKHYYHAMYDNGMSFYEADEYAWLITLFSYDIGVENAKKIIGWYWDDGCSTFEITVDDKEEVKRIAEKLGCDLDFSYWSDTTPNYISYDFVDCIEWIE